MSVKIRLQRVGTKKKPFYRVVATDVKQKRDGGVIDQLGRYRPSPIRIQFEVDEEKSPYLAQKWRPTDRHYPPAAEKSRNLAKILEREVISPIPMVRRR